MLSFSRNKQLYQLELNNLKLEISKTKISNEKIEKIRAKIDSINLILENVNDYINKLKFLLKVIVTEETKFRERRLNFINSSITKALKLIFPEENFEAYVDCDISRNRGYAQLLLKDLNGNDRIPSIQEGKMCQYLISFAAIVAVTSALGSSAIFIDEAFGAASEDNIQKMGPTLEKLANNGVQIILISQNSALYENIERREICFHKDPLEQKVVLDAVNDYTKSK